MRGGFDKSLPHVLKYEGGYVNHPKDPGGATNKGVTQGVYDDWRERNGLAKRSVRNITNVELREIYKIQYWDAVRGDQLPAGVDFVVFDGAVNSGPSRSIKWLQQALGVKTDGEIGTRTLAAIKRHTNHDALVAEICAIRMRFLKRLKHWSSFGKGWSARVAHVKKVGQMWATGAEAPPPPKEPAETPKAPESDIDRPSDALASAADASTAGGVVGTTISGTATQLEPVAHGNDTLMTIFVVLTLCGVALTVGGLALRWYFNRKKERAREAMGVV